MASLKLPSLERIYSIIDVGYDGDEISRGYDILYTLAIVVNLAATIAYTFNNVEAFCGPLLLKIEAVTVAFFGIDYVLRVITARYLYKTAAPKKASLMYMTSFLGIVDLLCFLPYYLPVFFPAGAAVFRMFRVVRIFRLFRINAYYDSLNVITEVLNGKKQQLVSSVFIILVLMLAASLCMYSIENEAQPEVFSNAFSGIWWAVSTLLTVGYGDIYPITPLGRTFSIVITFLGVGMVAIPTGIISAGFVDQYSHIKHISEYGREDDVHFIKMRIRDTDRMANMKIRDIGLPDGVLVAAVQRGSNVLVPHGDIVILPGDILVIGAEPISSDRHIQLKEIILQGHNPWIGCMIRDLDISRQTFIVLIKREGQAIIPRGDTVLLDGDIVILYSQSRLTSSYSDIVL